jgi:DNA-binding CsgD family transcriptional regulator
MRRDPVMQHCRRESLPIIWTQDTYVDRGQGELWEQMASFGYRTGIALALHLPEGRHFLLGVDRDQPLPADAANCSASWPTCSCLRCTRRTPRCACSCPARRPERPALTPRELEALRWTMEGKTAWEVGAILGITERTAVLHVNNAMHKLGCVNKHQAVLKALRLGLIH